MMRDIYEEVGEPAALELVAEEAAKLAQACLKLSRILRGENPTPVPEVLAAEKVMEEAADVPEGDDEWSCGCCMQWEWDTEILKTMQPAQQWTPCTPETMPDNEHDVLVTVEIRPVGRKPFRRVVRAFYTDGKHTDADSAYTWYELEEPDFDDDGNIIVPEGWWESSDYSEEVSPIDDFVISWREQPKPQKGEGNGDDK